MTTTPYPFGDPDLAFHPLMSLKKRLARLRRHPVTVERLGAMWELHPRDWIDNRLFIGRPFEREQLALAKELIESREIDVFFDCGSNIGLYSVLLGCRVPTLSKLHAFEPVPSTWARLSKNLELNDLKGRVTPHNYGLGAVPAHMKIALDQSSSGTATLNQYAKTQRGFTESQDIEIRVFDEVFKGSKQCAFFKIDVEGHEIEALKGMTRYLKTNDCILQIEAWDNNQDELIAFLAPHGYEEFHRIGPDIYFKKAT